MTAVAIPAVGPEAQRGWAHTVAEVDRLGAAVVDALDGTPPHEDTFAPIALTAMESVRPEFPVDDMIATLVTAANYPTQADPASQYGEPGVTMWRGDGFYIDAYLHVDPNTSVHSHATAGAFTVAQGTSSHVVYDLADEPCHAEGVLTGDLSVRESEVLGPGDYRPIPPGLGLIHSVVHVSQPALSIVVRLPATLDNAMYAFFLPGLGVRLDTAYTDTVRKKIKLLDSLQRYRDPKIGWRMVALLDNVSEASAAMLAAKYRPWDGAPELAEILAETRHAQDPWVARLLAAIEAGSFRKSDALAVTDERERLHAYARQQLPTPVGDRLLRLFDAMQPADESLR